MKRMNFSSTPSMLIAGVVLFPLASCDSKQPPAPSSSNSTSSTAPAAKVEKYTVRGVIEELPDPARKGASELQIHHENIPTFKDKSGKVVGMHSMVMGFPPGPGVVVPDLKKGDKVELDFEVTWTGKDPFYFTAIRKLPAETALDFSK